jgi:signal transduction histidine kinase
MEISDSGIGIPRADRSSLFTEFFRAENARAVDKAGTGLGLAIVKEYVEKLAGRMLVESEEGMGTIFVVDLPAAMHAKGGRHDSGATS